MTARDTMAAALRTTGLYTLSGETLVDCELAAYSAALDVLYERIAVLKRESFVETAEEEGLSNRELLFGLKPNGTVESRRKALLQCGTVDANAFTRNDFLTLFQSVGVEAEILEDPAGQKLTFNCSGPADAQARADAVEYLARFLPAHLDVTLDFRTLSWNTIDRAEQTFDEWDAQGKTWDELELAGDAMFEI